MRLLILLVLAAAIIAGQKVLTHQIPAKPIVLSTKPSTAVTPFVSVTNSPETTGVPSDTQIPTATPTNSPTNQPETTTNLIYPNAHQTTSSEGGITLESSDDPQAITNWYKNTIQKMGMNATSVIENTVNGDVTNQLTASGNGRSIKVQITKSSGSSTVTILLSS